MEMQAFKNKKEKGFMLRINEDEAMNIIKSLSAQILAKDGSSGRKEFYTDKHEYFSISVVCEKEIQFKKCLEQRQEIIDNQEEAIQQLYQKLEATEGENARAKVPKMP